jgi:hypothetical protein
MHRYERKKNIGLAISALQKFKAQRQQVPSSSAAAAEGVNNKKGGQRKVLLVVAGGYDLRVAENVEYLEVSRAEPVTVCLPAMHCANFVIVLSVCAPRGCRHRS